MTELPQIPALSIQSTMGMIVLYDPTLLQDRVKAASSWWRDDPLGAAERQDGRVALWPLSEGRATSRSYRVRMGTALTEVEEAYVVARTEPAAWLVRDTEVFLGPIERLPGDGGGDRLSAIPDAGQLVPMVPGMYAVTACVLDWQGEERFFNEDNEPVADAPPDVVLLIEAVDELPTPPAVQVPLLHLIPKKTATANSKVQFSSRPRAPIDFDEPKRKRARGTSEGGSRAAPRRTGPVQVKELRPGELGVGARVRHPSYGVGTVLFLKEGYPKAKVNFAGIEQKVDKDDLTVV
ncbi:MAG: hypothetical protein AB7N76_32870 [Planctomycetota bacterium]